MAMWYFQCAILWCGMIFGPLLYRNVWASLCHREEYFSKLETEGSFPSTTPIKVTTKSALTFCSIECLEVPGCKSIAFLTTTNTANCLLGPTIDGLATSTKAEVYKLKIGNPRPIKSCALRSPCKNGGTCIDVCEEPYYMCACPAHTQGDFCEWHTTLGCAEPSPLGMQSGKIRDDAITASSTYSGSYKPSFARLNNVKSSCCSWTPTAVGRVNSWHQVDLGQLTTVTGIATQGSCYGNEWTKSYSIAYSTDGNNWTYYQESGNARVFQANTDKDTIVDHQFKTPIEARYMRMFPKSWQGYPTTRLEYYDCRV